MSLATTEARAACFDGQTLRGCFLFFFFLRPVRREYLPSLFMMSVRDVLSIRHNRSMLDRCVTQGIAGKVSAVGEM